MDLVTLLRVLACLVACIVKMLQQEYLCSFIQTSKLAIEASQGYYLMRRAISTITLTYNESITSFL